MLNPLRSEGEAFQLLIYVLAVAIAIVAIIVLVRAL